MIIGIAHTAVTARDMDVTLRFYTEALGFRKAFEIKHPKTGEPWIIYLNICPGQFLELFYGGVQDNPWNGQLMGFSHLSLAVDDINVAVQQVKDAGFPIDSEPRQGSDHNWQAWLKDPNGVRIELMQIMPDSPQAQFM